MNDSFFRDDLDKKKVSSEEDAIVKDKKIISKIDKHFSNDQTNVKIVLVVGILAIVLGAWHSISGVKNAFVISPIVLEDKSNIVENLNQLKDTDKDGLSDYDEKYVYGTSPYLSDTDSDGVSDYEEILAGQAPLCAGGTCQENLNESVNSTSISTDLLDSGPSALISLEELKSNLIEAGYPAEEVNKLSEADLNLIYAEVEKAVSDENYVYKDLDINLDTEDKVTLSAEELEQLQNLSIDEIKNLLIQGGATTEQLESVSDEELKSLYLEILKEY